MQVRSGVIASQFPRNFRLEIQEKQSPSQKTLENRNFNLFLFLSYFLAIFDTELLLWQHTTYVCERRQPSARIYITTSTPFLHMYKTNIANVFPTIRRDERGHGVDVWDKINTVPVKTVKLLQSDPEASRKACQIEPSPFQHTVAANKQMGRSVPRGVGSRFKGSHTWQA